MAKQKNDVVVVDQDRWLCAEVREAVCDSALETSLYDRTSGLLCCLGFGSRQCGAKVREISGQGYPNDVPAVQAKAAKRPTSLAAKLVSIEEKAATLNDNERINLSERKRKLKSLFKGVGIDLQFVGSTKNAIKRARKAYPEAKEY